MQKFQYVVACQVYGRMKKNQDPKADDIEMLLQRFPNLRVAYIDEVRLPGPRIPLLFFGHPVVWEQLVADPLNPPSPHRALWCRTMHPSSFLVFVLLVVAVCRAIHSDARSIFLGGARESALKGRWKPPALNLFYRLQRPRLTNLA